MNNSNEFESKICRACANEITGSSYGFFDEDNKIMKIFVQCTTVEAYKLYKVANKILIIAIYFRYRWAIICLNVYAVIVINNWLQQTIFVCFVKRLTPS